MVEKSIEVPEGVSVEVDGKRVKVSGEKGSLERTFKYVFDIKIRKEGNRIIVSSPSERRKVKAMVGTIIAHIRNMIKGVTKGYKYRLRIVYKHFPISVKVEGDKVLIHNFLGERTVRVAKIVGDTKVDVKGKDIEVTGINVEDVAQTAANIEQACRITKYDRRVFVDGIFIVGKE
ncbi:MAG TPA: 50S ribosomal protein L6 [Candidatus Aenigmarchaeota archaeon]|nr:50S ribosomal protein L6 [Candidatus Aenigmarchaeota archaeon]